MQPDFSAIILGNNQKMTCARAVAINDAIIVYNSLIIKYVGYLEGVVAHGRASSNLAFGTIFKP